MDTALMTVQQHIKRSIITLRIKRTTSSSSVIDFKVFITSMFYSFFE